jgi:hypothetical protein
MNFNDALAKALRYSIDTIHTLLNELQTPEYNDHRWGTDKIYPTQGLRGVLADAMDEQGRSVEADLLRTKRQHVMVDENKRVRPARFTDRHIRNLDNAVVDRIREATDGDYTPVHAYGESEEHGHPYVDFNDDIQSYDGMVEGLHIGDMPHILHQYLNNVRLGYGVRGDEDLHHLLRSLRNAPYEEVDTRHSTER